jgi:16S rRNA (cytosine1402-N4)-methyltransferase
LSAAHEHDTVLLEQAVEGLNVRPSGTYVDCTFGRGGHSRLILTKLGADGRLIALDRDPEAIAAGEAFEDPRMTLMHAAFGRLAEHLARLGISRVHGILLDLGVSSRRSSNKVTAASASGATHRSTCAWTRRRAPPRRSGSRPQPNPKSGR